MSQSGFTQLYSQNEHAIYGFVYSLLADRNAADDVMQDAMAQLWEHFEEYDPSRPFFPWACRFAYRQVLMRRRRESGRRRFFSESTLEKIAEESPQNRDWEESRLPALQGCLAQLTDRQRELIHHRYSGDIPLSQLADQIGRSVGALYKSLERIRRLLADCVQRKLVAEGIDE